MAVRLAGFARPLSLENLDGFPNGLFVDQSIGDVLMEDARNKRLVRKALLLRSSFELFEDAFRDPDIDRASFSNTVNDGLDFTAVFCRHRPVRTRSCFDLSFEGI